MRRIKKLLAMAAAGLFLGTASTYAQSTQLVGITNTLWRYSGDNSDQYAAGFPNVDDSAWPEGSGLFGNDTGYPYPFVSAVPGGITSYYRTRFNFSGSTSGVVLTMTNHIDDGIIIYLNGTEIVRYNMVDAAPTASHASLAAAANPLGEPVRIVHQVALDAMTNGSGNPLVSGQNTLAVSVHNNSTTSSDTVFGMSVYSSRIIAPCSPGITPTSLSSTECRNVTFNLTIPAECGVPAPTIQWYKNVGVGEEIITGQTGTSLSLTNVQAADAGQYYARLVNSVASADSAHATLTVTPDTTGPVIVSFVAPATPDNEWLVTFDEPVQPFGGADDNLTYLISTADDSVVFEIQTATFEPNNPAQIRLKTTESRVVGASYKYTIPVEGNSGYADACKGNITPPGASGPILQTINVLDWTDGRDWRYNQSGADQGTAWQASNFDDSTWDVGPQGFGNETGGFPDAPDSQRTALTVGATQITYYFRTKFTIPAGSQNVKFYARVDDGAAIYINGTEIGRVNIAANIPLAYNTFVANVFDPENSGYAPAAGIPIPSNLLVAGQNTLAVEVHQTSATSSDVILLARITAEAATVTVPAPEILTQPASTAVSEGRNFTLSVIASPAGVSYQWSKDGVDIAGANSATYTTTASATSAGVYRVVVSNSAGSLTSDPATVVIRRQILALGSTWKYETNCLDGANWTAPGFDDSAWQSGAAPLGVETTAPTLARIPAIATALPPPSATFISAYFRSTVTVPALGANESVFLTHIVDDAAAFYVDGNLVLAYNLNNAPSACLELAPGTAPGDGDAREVTVPIALTAGTHTLAVEVKQNSATSSDVVFAAELTRGPKLPVLTITHPTANTAVVTWTPATGVKLLQSTTVNGGFTPVAGNPQGTHSATIPTTAGNLFFRLGY